MFSPHPIRSPTLAIALSLALLTSAMSGPAAARPMDEREKAQTSSLAGTPAPRQDLRSPDARDAARQSESSALAIERSYSAYPSPVDAPGAPAGDSASTPVVSDGSGVDWTAIAAVVAGSLLTVTAVVAFTVRRPRRRVAT